MRIPLATSLQSRDGTTTKDARIVNGMVEAIGESSMVRKRPGLAIGSLIRVGTAQLAYWWNGLLNTVIGDYFNQGVTPTLSTTLNPSDKSAAVTLSGGNLVAEGTGGGGSVRSVGSISTGSFYYEVTVTGPANWYVGVANSSATLISPITSGANVYAFGGQIYGEPGGSFLFAAGVLVANDVVGVLVNRTAGTVAFYRNGSLRYTASGAQVPTGALYALVCPGAPSSFCTVNFGATAFVYPVPASSTVLSPTSAGLQFTAQDSGSNAASSQLMIKNASQAWTVDSAGAVTSITDVDYPGTYTVTATSLTRSGTVARVTTPTNTNFQVGSTVTIAGATPSAYNGAQVVTAVTGSSTVSSKRVAIGITRSGTTATATTTKDPHTFKTGDLVPITGASQAEYNGTFAVTYISATQFSFAVTISSATAVTTTGSAIASPATGTLTVNRKYNPNVIYGQPVIISGTTVTFLAAGTWVVGQSIAPRDFPSFGNYQPPVNYNGTFYAITGLVDGGFTVTIASPPPSIASVYIGLAALPAITSITQSAGIATATTASSHFLYTGQIVSVYGATPEDYNKYETPITVTSATTFTYSLVQSTTTTTTAPATPATGTIFAGTPGSAIGASFTFTIAGSPATPATGTITVAGGRNTVPGIAYINGYFCVMDVNGVIYNSAEDNPGSWTALEYTTAQAENGAGKAIAKSLNYLVAFKEWSTEFFYDAKNPPPGSPFSPVDNGFTQIGCASGDSLCEVDGSLMWVAQAKQRGRSVYSMQGTNQQKVSTPDIDRILNLSTLSSVFAYGLKVDGHTLYVLTLPVLGITLVYDAQSQTWGQWSTLTAAASKSVTSITRVGTTATATTSTAHGLADGDPVTMAGASQSDYNGTFQISYISTTVYTFEVANSPTTPATGTITAVPYTETYFKFTKYANAGGTNTFLHESTGYTSTMSSSVYQDNSAPINLLIRTSRLDGGSLAKKTIGAISVIGDSVADVISLRWSDDDYTTFTKYRRVTLSNQRPMVRRCGSFRRRSIDARHIGNTPIRLESLEIGE